MGVGRVITLRRGVPPQAALNTRLFLGQMEDGSGLLDQVVGDLVPAARARPGGGGEKIAGDFEDLAHAEVSAPAGGGCA